MSSTTERVAVFYHVAHLGSWEAVDAQIMGALTESGLLERADVFVRNDCRHTELYEFPTLEMLHAFAQRNDYCVLYLHTKGVTLPIESVDDWRACMLYWMVERWRECVAKLETHEAVGCNHISSPVRHFQGNFWWARSRLIRKLGPVQDVTFTPTYANQTERHKAEFWLLGRGANAYMPYHHRLNPYESPNPRENYEGLVF